jgi:hypothetical protein
LNLQAKSKEQGTKLQVVQVMLLVFYPILAKIQILNQAEHGDQKQLSDYQVQRQSDL